MHAIRLQGPWEYEFFPEAVTKKNALSPPPTSQNVENEVREATASGRCRVTLPLSWRGLFGHQAGRAVFFRRFNRPTRLEATDDVALILPADAGEVTLHCNETPVPLFAETLAKHTIPGDRWPQLISANLAPCLQTFNEIAITIDFDPSRDWTIGGGLWRPVRLVIWEG